MSFGFGTTKFGGHPPGGFGTTKFGGPPQGGFGTNKFGGHPPGGFGTNKFGGPPQGGFGTNKFGGHPPGGFGTTKFGGPPPGGFGTKRPSSKPLSYIPKDRKIKLLTDVDKEIKEYNFKGHLDILETLFKTKNEKDAYSAIISKSSNLSYISNCISYGIKIRPLQSEQFLNILGIFTANYGFRNNIIDYVKDLLIHQGIIQGKLPEKSLKEIVNIFPDESIELAIKNDDAEKFNSFINKPDFKPKQRVRIEGDSPLFFVDPTNVKKENVIKNDKTVSVQYKEISYMQIAAFFGSLKCFKIAISLGTFDFVDTEKYAVAGGNSELIRLLDKNGGNFNNCFKVSVKYHRYEVSDWLLENYNCETISPGLALYFYNIRAFFFLINCDSEKDRKSFDNALLEAARTGNSEAIKYLIEECNADIETKDNFEHTPLYLAASNGHIDVVKYLAKECHADPEARSKNNCTPIYVASEKGHLDIVKFLVEECDVNTEIRFRDNFIPMYVAASNGRLKIVQYFIEKCKTDVETATKKGFTPLYIASSKEHFDVVQYLVETCHANINQNIIEKAGNEEIRNYLKSHLN